LPLSSANLKTASAYGRAMVLGSAMVPCVYGFLRAGLTAAGE
jgi:hypothetical protein